ncbi:MAG: hypothetical protein A2655_01650 [Candidatus Yanofskybacteria bacterium RIFCSPHIGHO2_01_FULL_43_42]|uniref:DUF8128 domain-containing protein n=1 Tax=Candidatus Yanofskybacteria bacterium RIFCSPLOWO2_01_FULL_43_22 TaxID=1802695 RepID=A0A1F8GIQ7_9BACT|nr:MAG: hypothetical protein A2655_01650 [Candidatus Yanofskybacteria bacterium RIFCSPHIGHO2_01_FULL_43_42]OGN13183.1 MAG: hypothetical protein A3D48_02555 [Candidatus Yanofskybacteria bacterium RIFCSPHIGHO2_02_FULL_43_17]OGN24598.1 MAG: hypothetical protein A3A13_00780 [Candidatus Yanofskybacteria bacterium RIFCSPLOWO2_01_FULL_43_22]
MEQLLLIQDSLSIVWNVLSLYWWLYLPILLFSAWLVSFETYNRLNYLASLEWILLEIRVPREVNKSPKGMEQVFAALYGIFLGPVRWQEKFFKGKVPDWFSFEIAGTGGETHFYVRTQTKYRNLVESQIYAQYPDVELVEAEDYVSALPPFLPNQEYDLWGGEEILSKEDAYPIRTYPEFEEKGTGPDIVKRIDPIASIVETIASLDYKEYISIQLLIRPAGGDEWVKKGQAVVDKLMGKKAKPKEDWLTKTIFGIDALLSGGSSEKKEEKKEHEQLSPGKQEVLKAVERNFTKLGFEGGIRLVYIFPKNMFHITHLAAMNGAFKQFASPSLNSFKLNKSTTPPIRGFLYKQKAYRRKSFMYRKLRDRSFVQKPIILTTEELATVYHFPDVSVKSPLLPRVEAKKGEPPAGLPIG